ncbi:MULTISPECIES: J domain-containing protein [unclassified Cyanobium]|uniref:J domain-containing protein n=1 Tax=unclassified Cyanobium TaxID=2627006 RepID=UPI0021BC4D63|nr:MULTISPECIES: J domain-containing protein [unclassified Cyanobium]MCP9833153.1 J domain-containing protein [Cyanobium sp. La Preciosa 7G6]MCP9935984.1 J domain-containing protein [Cyanobium sp. Aljojuca 7A6]
MSSDAKQRISLDLTRELVSHLDGLRREWGIRSRGDVLERLLHDLFGSDEEDDDGLSAESGQLPQHPDDSRDFDEQGALVLLGRGAMDTLQAEFEWEAPTEDPPRPVPGGGGIDLPGFVRRRSDVIKRSLRPPSPARAASLPLAPLPALGGELVQQALEEAGNHWHALYGSPANEAVLEAAMVWLAQDIWPQSDQSDGRSFTWSAACQVMQPFAPGWSEAAPTFERVMVTAGVLEDPFSGQTLTLRIPTLIRRFVHRFRRRRRGTSFQTLEHTMTLHGALRLLQLPTDPGQRLTLAQIREAYRDMAQSHHPDAGGSLEAMRRLNEAYQLLKELYRQGASVDR